MWILPIHGITNWFRFGPGFWPLLVILLGSCILTFGRLRKLFLPPWYNRARKWVFAMIQYFGNILRLIDSLWYALQDKKNTLGYGAAGGRWRHPKWPLSWILVKNEIYRWKRGNCKYFLPEFQNIVLLKILLLLVSCYIVKQ